MPVSALHSPSIEVLIHRTAGEFLEAAWASLFKRESVANTILPYALEAFSVERASRSASADTILQSSPNHLSSESRLVQRKPVAPILHSDYFWLTCWSTCEGQDPVLDIALSCTSGTLGTYPIFLYSSLPHTETTHTFLDERVATLVARLLSVISTTRMFSVFGPKLLVESFTRQWSEFTGIKQRDEPFYAASLLYATRHTLIAPIQLPYGDSIRRAISDDLLAVGKFCKEFANSSVYYPLTYERSNQEAMELIHKRQVWVYETRKGHIASIVAVTRTSPSVSAITKVYTDVAWRRRGYAEQLVKNVTRELLYNAGKQCVVLYVSHGNPAAKVYRRAGFMAREHRDRPEAEEWLEIGFEGIRLGHW